jgi:hypothetical protein
MAVVPAGMSVMTRPCGLDIVAAKVILDACGIRLDADLLADLQIIEHAVLAEVSK